jgi:ribonuclease R
MKQRNKPGQRAGTGGRSATQQADRQRSDTPRPTSSGSGRQSSASAETSRPSRTAVRGLLRLNLRGFAFVTPVNGSDDRSEDLFVGANLLKGFLDGDVVDAVVDTSGRSQAKRLTLVERTRSSFIGTVLPGGSTVRIDPGVGVDEFRLARPAPAGKVVRCRFKGSDVVVLEVLGSDGEPHVGMCRYLDRYQLPLDRPAGVAEQAALPGKLAPLAGRRDLREQLVITIDDDSTKDIDDALAAEVEEDGSIRLWVHIADVAEHVPEDSAIDRAAFEIPTSVYLPQGVRHMLPDALASNRLSLLPGVERDTLCAELRLDANGEVRGVDLYEARIVSRQRLSYTTVARVIDGRHVDLAPEVLDLVRVLRTAATRLGLLRAARGGLDSMRVDQQAGHESASESAAHQLIERLMVAANEAVAEWLSDRGMPALWRVHDPIKDDQVPELERVAAGFGVVAALGSPVSARALACTVAQVPAGNGAAAFWDALLGVLGRARYSTTPGGHFGLGSTGYLHFTSPLRRYPDLLVHRIVKGYLAGFRDGEAMLPFLAEAAIRANDVFRRAAMAERDATVALGLAELAVGQTVMVTVSGRARNGALRVRLDDPAVSGFLAADLAPGDRASVRVAFVDPVAGRLELEPLDGPRRSRSKEAHGHGRRPRAESNRKSGRPQGSADRTDARTDRQHASRGGVRAGEREGSRGRSRGGNRQRGG